jgi:hypothetical protein
MTLAVLQNTEDFAHALFLESMGLGKIETTARAVSPELRRIVQWSLAYPYCLYPFVNAPKNCHTPTKWPEIVRYKQL